MFPPETSQVFLRDVAPGVNIMITTRRTAHFDIDEMWKREKRSWDYWFALNEGDQRNLQRTVVTELERLIANIDQWLPAGMNPDEEHPREKPLDIVIRISPDHTAPRGPLTDDERRKANEVILSLMGILEDE